MDRIAGYELRGVLGEGGMGTVYRAHDPTLDRPAAIKVIRTEALSDEGRERFLREARACSRINHPNIITVYAAGEEDGRPYLAMELIEGRTLRQVIDEGAIDWRTATHWIVCLLDALERLHAEGIIHRDLKPENIMVTRDGVIKLMDFGVAHLASSTAITQEGTAVGTVPYMSPEQVLGRRLDARSDLFSVATIYHEMLTGQHPFRGDHAMAIMYSIGNETPRPIKIRSGDFPVGLQAVLDRGFAKEVDKRYPDAAAFRAAILELAPDVAGAAPPPTGASMVRMALIIAVVATIVFGAGLGVLNAVQKHRATANRAAAHNLNELGQTMEAKGDDVGAEQKYREAIAKDPTYPVPYNNLGFLAVQRGDSAEADRMFHTAIAREPRYSWALFNLGNLVADAHPDSAEAYYRRAAAGNDPPAGANQLAAMLITRGEYGEAKTVIDSVLAMPMKPAVRGHLLKNRGKAMAALGDSASAMVQWKQALALLPADPELQRLVGTPR